MAVDTRPVDKPVADRLVGKPAADKQVVDMLPADKQAEPLQVLEPEQVPVKEPVRVPEWKPAEQWADRNSSKKTRHQRFENHMIRKTSLPLLLLICF